MLITFHSAASADVIMFGDDAKRLLSALGKDAGDAQGIITEMQIPDAIARLQSLIDAARAAAEPESDDGDEEAPRGMSAPVSVVQRAYPLLEMLRYAQREGCPVTWDR